MDAETTRDTTNALLDKYAAAEGLRTDYQLAKSLGCAFSTIHNYRRGKTKMDATTAVQIAERLRIDPLAVIAETTLERQTTPRTRRVWEKYRGRVLLAALLALVPIWGQFCAKSAIADETRYTLYALICASLWVLRVVGSRKDAPGRAAVKAMPSGSLT